MSNKKHKLKRILIIISIVLITIFLSILSMFAIFYNKYNLDINKLTSVNNGIKVYSSTGVDSTLYNTSRSIVEIETLPKYVPEAFISAEDKRFYSHSGYDLKRIIKAMTVNLTTQTKSQGASTISQQLVKNALLSNEKTYSRKIKEIVLSIKMEKKFTKDKILEMYLNTIYFGANAYGIENASITYFNKSAKDLTISEACCLAGIIKSPNYYSPKNNISNATTRRDLIANLMFKNGYISNSQYIEVVNSPITITTTKDCDHSYEEEAIHEACQLLNISERELINRKYQIITYKDDPLQSAVSKANNDTLQSAKIDYDTNLDSLSMVCDTNGHMLAYYTNSHYDLHNIARQPASTLKPLAVYLPCLIHNILTPASTILDEEINYNGFAPHNADGLYHGDVSVREAITQSLNIPAVKALDYVGLNKSKDTLSKLGIELSNSDLNLSLALGAVNKQIRLVDLLSAYNTLANMGRYQHITFINRILDDNGKVIYENEHYSKDVLDDENVYLLNDMLKDVSKYGTAKRLNSLNIPIASKTGTAANQVSNTDLYNIAYTTEHTMLSWIANIQTNALPNDMHSSNQPTEINKLISTYLYNDHDPKDFYKPEGIERLPYDIVELETNYTLVSPTVNIDRYIAYDYFKSSNPPKKITSQVLLDYNLSLDKNGVRISFLPKRNQLYSIYREDKKKRLIQQIKDTDTMVTVRDGSVFDLDEISYYIEDQNGNIISKINKVRPKDYLVNMLNNEVSSKKKWYI